MIIYMVIKTEVIREFESIDEANEFAAQLVKDNIQHGVKYIVEDKDIGEPDWDQYADKGQND